MTPDQIAAMIPEEVVEAAAIGLCLAQGYIWERHPEFQPAWRREARAAIAAGLAKWPGMVHMAGEAGTIANDGEREHLILPLPPEPKEKNHE